MSKLTVNDTALHTRIDGDQNSNKPWIILSNSLGSNLSMWDEQIPLLSQHYRVLRYDTRGHGQSDVPAGPYTLDQLEADVIALMDTLGIEQAAFMGLSMGGMTGMGLALKHPARFSRIVVCDARADGPEAFRKSWDDRAVFIRENGMAALVPSTLERWLTPAFQQQHPDKTRWIGDMVANTDPDGYISCARALQQLDYLKDLPGISVPVLYVGGDRDVAAMPDVMQQMADATPGGKYMPVDQAAHIANVDNPAGFAAAITGFLELDK